MTHNKPADNQKGSSMLTGFAGDTQKRPGERQPGQAADSQMKRTKHADR